MASEIGWGIYTGDKCPLGGEGKVFAAYKKNQALFVREIIPYKAYVGTIANNMIPVQISGPKADRIQFQLEEIADTIAPVASTIPRAHIGIFTKQ